MAGHEAGLLDEGNGNPLKTATPPAKFRPAVGYRCHRGIQAAPVRPAADNRVVHPEGNSMNIQELFDRVLSAYAAYAGCVCGACAD
ncbi:hypothetical protein [Geopseudomonas aromaticivorans]